MGLFYGSHIDGIQFQSNEMHIFRQNNGFQLSDSRFLNNVRGKCATKLGINLFETQAEHGPEKEREPTRCH